jgi:hypothetical protein
VLIAPASPCEELPGSPSAHSTTPADAEFASTSSNAWEIVAKQTCSATARVIVAQLHLPLLDSVAGADLRATGRTLSFQAAPGCGYTNIVCVELPVDMNVDVDRCVATFSKRSHILRVRLSMT